MNRFFIPANKPEDWKWLLSEPDRQWKTGYSTKALAHCWQEANDFPLDVRNIFITSGMELFRNLEMLSAFPEYKVFLPPFTTPPLQNDIFILARGGRQLVSVIVQGKTSEPFGETVKAWLENKNRVKQKRLNFLIKKLKLEHKNLDDIRYELLCRTASALTTAERFNSGNALMLVHSFSRFNRWSGDYKKFVALFGLNGKADSLTGPKNIKGIDLYFAWVKGDRGYLEK